MKHFVLAASLVCATMTYGCQKAPVPTPVTKVPSTPVVSSIDAANESKLAADRSTHSTPTAANVEHDPKSRSFTFHYRFKVKDLKSSDDSEKNVVRVWLPAATSSDAQTVTRLESIAPNQIAEHTDAQFGNSILYFETKIPESGEFTVDVPYEVTRREVLRAKSAPAGDQVASLDDAKRTLFLRADKMVPIEGKPLKLLDMVDLLKDRMSLARQLYDIVDDHVAYKKEGTGWGRGDSNWVCDSRYGNCTDFHSLFISLARSQGMPSRFEIGFSIPTDKPEGPIAGYHCWAWFHTEDRGWIPVDISEADKNPKMKDYYFGGLTPDRVTFSMGRDIELFPPSASQPLNFFIYPHLEVGGEPLPKENVELQFGFQGK